MLGTDGRLYDSNFDFDGDGKLNAYEYSVMDDVVFGHEDTETSEVDGKYVIIRICQQLYFSDTLFS